MFKYLFLFFPLLLHFRIHAQVLESSEENSRLSDHKEVVLEEEISIKARIEKLRKPYELTNKELNILRNNWLEKNKEGGVVDGYRVQIAVGPKDSIYTWNEQFVEQFPDIPTYMLFSPPSFKLRVGNFYGPWAFWEANILTNRLKDAYTSAIYVKEKIRIEDLKKNNGRQSEDKSIK